MTHNAERTLKHVFNNNILTNYKLKLNSIINIYNSVDSSKNISKLNTQQRYKTNMNVCVTI